MQDVEEKRNPAKTKSAFPSPRNRAILSKNHSNRQFTPSVKNTKAGLGGYFVMERKPIRPAGGAC